MNSPDQYDKLTSEIQLFLKESVKQRNTIHVNEWTNIVNSLEKTPEEYKPRVLAELRNRISFTDPIFLVDDKGELVNTLAPILTSETIVSDSSVIDILYAMSSGQQRPNHNSNIALNLIVEDVKKKNNIPEEETPPLPPIKLKWS